MPHPGELEHRGVREPARREVLSNAPKNDAEAKRFLQSGRACPREEPRQRRHDALVALTQECGQDVLADSLAPEVIAAVAARMRGGIEVDPMVLDTARDPVPAVADPLTAESKAPLQTVEVDASCGVEVDLHFVRHDYSQSKRKNTRDEILYTDDGARFAFSNFLVLAGGH